MRSILFPILTLALLGQVNSRAATINARSVSFIDVNSAVALASEGDTVVLPAGTASWTQGLTITKGITLKGATTVTGDHNSALTAADRTIIVDNIPRVNGDALVLNVVSNAGQRTTISGLTIRGGTVTQMDQNGGGLALSGDSTQVRVTQMHFDLIYSLQEMVVLGRIYGVIDHSVFDSRDLSILFLNGGMVDTYGDEAWADSAHFGEDKFFFAEDCSFNNPDPSIQTHANTDCYRGGRYVARYSIFNNSKPNSHGTETPGRQRSSRAVEIYNNKLKWADRSYGATGGQLRGGALLIHDNTYSNFVSGMGLRVYREFGTYIFSGADGTCGWDVNDSHGVYANGTASVTSAAGSLTVSGSPWTQNQWVGFVIRNTTVGNAWNSYVTSNTANTITFVGGNGGDGVFTFKQGNTFEIRKVLIALDQPGRGKGDLITGYPPLNSTTGTVAWPHQALEPVFSWNNSNDGASIGVASYGEPTLKENVDYYNRAPQDGDPVFPYTPYVYPHPLASDTPRPSSPSNLRVVGP
jgi:hypothetical protein